jgi:hypothetical protein
MSVLNANSVATGPISPLLLLRFFVTPLVRCDRGVPRLLRPPLIEEIKPHPPRGQWQVRGAHASLVPGGDQHCPFVVNTSFPSHIGDFQEVKHFVLQILMQTVLVLIKSITSSRPPSPIDEVSGTRSPPMHYTLDSCVPS